MTKNELKIQVGQNLYKYRLEQGFTREHVANAIGISSSFYASVENGRKSMHLFHLLKAADFFSADLDSLVRGDYDQKHIHNISKLLEEQPKYVVNDIEKFTRLYVNEFNLRHDNNSDTRDLVD
jgi:transcriptional regulator with XRE-family HTH domain